MGSRGLALWVLGLSACARQNPAFGDGAGSAAETGDTGVVSTTSASTTALPTGGDTHSSTVSPTADGGTTLYAASSEGGTLDTDVIAESTGPGGCEIVRIGVESDTFVTNAGEGCGGGCATWAFSGTANYPVRSAGQLDAVMLLRFEPPGPYGEIEDAHVEVHVAGPLPPGVGLFEVHVLDTQSEWIATTGEGPIPGEPTFNEARGGMAPWLDGNGDPLTDFDGLRDDWPTAPAMPGDDADLVLEFPIQAEDESTLAERLAAAAPVTIGVTVLGDEAVEMSALEAGAVAHLELTACR